MPDTLRNRRDADRRTLLFAALTFATPALALAADPPAKPASAPAKVSYYKDVRPIFQVHCQGCHQPAKAGGGYVMTAFDRMLAGGSSKLAAVTPGKTVESHLIELITPEGATAEMPKDKPPLSKVEIETVSSWINQGAIDDTPPAAKVRYDRDHPPVYSRPPVITTLDYSPDGSLLAVGGFHEVLLWKADGSELVARLVGLSERVESVRFSPDGKKLAVTGGNPARMGEVQVWDVAKKSLVLSVPLTFDTVNGASWSPDGTHLAVGCADNTVRALDAKTGAQTLYMGSHNDWALDTVWSLDGSHIISVGRDQSAKLTEVATQRFVDNITSITPGALKGGIAAVARHPKRDEIVVGGSDGVPKVYRAFRQTVRVIGDDSNLIRELPVMPGRVYTVAVSADGKRIAAGSSLDGSGLVNIYGYEFDTALPEKLKAIMSKVADSRSPEEREAVKKYHSEGVTLVSHTNVDTAGVYALAFRPDGKVIAAAGADGLVRFIDPATGSVVKSYAPAPLGPESSASAEAKGPVTPLLDEALAAEKLPAGMSVESLDVRPTKVELNSPFDYTQLIVSAKLNTGETVDVTRIVDSETPGGLVALTRAGVVRPLLDGQGAIKIAMNGRTLSVPVSVKHSQAAPPVDYVRDVTPVLSKLGCNQGTCHGSAQGKNGFKLSLRGYDPLFDVRALTDDHGSRRVNLASPDDSLMLLKPTGAVPHVGGALVRQGEPYYRILRDWIAAGAKLDRSSAKAVKLEVDPINPVVQRVGSTQQLRVLATFPSGEVRDVTREAFLESGNNEVASTNRTGLITALRRGEAPILVRYEGNYAATTLTVMGDRTGFAWVQPPANNRIDELAADKWRRMKTLPSELCTDDEFLRRVYLDLTGLPPTPEEVRAFLADARETRVKRDGVIDRLIGTPEFVDYWTNKWADLLQVNRKFLDVEGAAAFRNWIKARVAENAPYDKFVKAVLTAQGSNRENPAASYYKILREPTAVMENTTQLFLAVRFNCNKCHDHPFERWTQDQYYQTSAYFARVGLKEDPESKGRKIGGTAVEGATPLYEAVYEKPDGEVKHERTSQVAPPKFPFPAQHPTVEKESRREELASWITSAENPYFARSYVNRLWGYLLGVGLIEPIDDIRAGNPASNPELLDYLTAEFLKSGFDPRHMLKLIAKSRVYQLSVATHKWNDDDRTNYSHATARRLPAEVLLDAVYRVTGSQSKFPGVAAGVRAAALPDSGVELPSGFLTTFGRPARESACECERSSGMQLGPVMALVSGPTLGDAIADPANAVTSLTAKQADDKTLVNELFVRILNRPATPAEIEACVADLKTIDSDHTRLAGLLGQREAEFAVKRPQLERERDAARVSAEAALAEYQKGSAPRTQAFEAVKVTKVAAADAALKAYEASLLPKLAAWEKAQSTAVRWLPLTPKTLKASNGATLTAQPDASIVATGSDEPGVITVQAETDLVGITGVRLEMLADPQYPDGGPGRAPDGNFVINEFKVSTTAKADPKAVAVATLANPLSDFNQGGFDIKQTIDKSLNKQQGWAISPSYGVTHWATYDLAQPIGAEGGTTLTFALTHRYGKGFMPGRFRLSVTRVPKPVGLGLPEDYRATIALAPELRTKAQSDALLAHFRSADGEWLRLSGAAAGAKAEAMPADQNLVSLRKRVEESKAPVPLDPALEQLRRDVDMSVRQAATRRLTAAQDIAWALINSPAFLFNH